MSHPYLILLFMIVGIAERAEAAAADLLAAVNTGGASTTELRAVLDATRSVAAAVTAAQTAAAEQIARREHHGDDGAEILAASAGLSQREARNQVATAAALQQVPRLRDAVQAGDVSQANARRLADAITRTDSAAVGGDAGLLAQARSMRPEQFAKTAQRWIGAHQADDGTAEYLRQRAKRYLRIFDTEDGMVRLQGEFDKITGTRLRNRLRHTASRLLDADKKLPKTQRREFPQCMADALQHHTTRTSTSRGQNAEAASRSRRSTGLGSDVSNSHNPTKETANPSTRGDSSGAATSTGTSGGGGAGNTSSGDDAHRRARPPHNTDTATSTGTRTGAGTSASSTGQSAEAASSSIGVSDAQNGDTKPAATFTTQPKTPRTAAAR